jgi:hypothetical protein
VKSALEKVPSLRSLLSLTGICGSILRATRATRELPPEDALEIKQFFGGAAAYGSGRN